MGLSVSSVEIIGSRGSGEEHVGAAKAAFNDAWGGAEPHFSQ